VQASPDHDGDFYRQDIIERTPELRIMIPVHKGNTKMDIYLVRLSNQLPLKPFFTSMALYEGSAAFEHGREATLQHLLYAVAEMMKQLFWAGDLQYMRFPKEIEVYPLLIQDEIPDKKNR